MARNGYSVTKWIGNLVDDTKVFVDDALDRVKDLEGDARGLVRDAAGDDRVEDRSGDLDNLQAALSDLTAKVEELSRTMERSGSSKSRAA